MSDALFREIKQPLKKRVLTPLNENAFSWIQERTGITDTYNELKKMFEEKGLSIECVYSSTVGIHSFWYIDGFVYVPLPNLDSAVVNMFLNKEAVEENKKRLQKLWDSADYSAFFSMIEAQFGFDIFFTHIDGIGGDKQYEIFRELYTRNEYGFQEIDPDLINKLFSLNPDYSFRKNLLVEPDGFVTIYRGTQSESASPEDAYSWTLDFTVATQFAIRFNSNECGIYQARVRPEGITDYIQSRGEEEILILPEKLVDVKDMGFYSLNGELMNELKENNVIDLYQKYAFDSLKGKWFHKPDGIHGKRHIKRVLFLSLMMSYFDDLSLEDRMILIYASLYHDIGRTNDWEDEGHGMQSVLKMEKLKLTTKGLNEEEVAILKFVMKYHSIRDEVGLRKIETEREIYDKERAIDLFKRFKDCDGLDRVRLGDLDIRYLRTGTGRKLMLVAYQLLQNIE